ncbi:MAG: 3,4-dihydroxy-2-butanone-4-phosphate synthase [Actinobacteria bacterium]|nr:3,4-dihydroxy-2-butanone-4-phosphate synthase [Actinomycetota bacterium]
MPARGWHRWLGVLAREQRPGHGDPWARGTPAGSLQRGRRRALDDLQLPPMPMGPTSPGHRGRSQCQFRVAVDAAHGVSTGISAADRTRTVRVLAGRSSTPADLVRPGHVFPVRAEGLTERASPAGAAVALMTRAQLAPVAVIATVTNDDGELPSEADLQRFAAVHQLESVHLGHLVEQHMRDHPGVRREAGSSPRCRCDGAAQDVSNLWAGDVGVRVDEAVSEQVVYSAGLEYARSTSNSSPTSAHGCALGAIAADAAVDVGCVPQGRGDLPGDPGGKRVSDAHCTVVCGVRDGDGSVHPVAG